MLNNITYKTAEVLKRVGFPQHIDISKKPKDITDNQYISQFPPHSPSVEELLHILRGKIGSIMPILQMGDPDFYIWDIDLLDVPNRIKIELCKKYNNQYEYALSMNGRLLNPDGSEWDLGQIKNPFNIVKRNLGEFLATIYIDLKNKKVPLSNKNTIKKKPNNNMASLVDELSNINRRRPVSATRNPETELRSSG